MKKIKTQTKVGVSTRTAVILAVATLSVAGVAGVILNRTNILGQCPPCDCLPAQVATTASSSASQIYSVNSTCKPLPKNLYKPYVPDAYQLDGAATTDSIILVIESNYNNNLVNDFEKWVYANAQVTNVGGYKPRTNNVAYCETHEQDSYYWIKRYYLQKVKDYIANKPHMKIYTPPIDPTVKVLNVTSSSAKIIWGDFENPNAWHLYHNIAFRLGTDQKAVNSGCPNGTGSGTGCIIKEGAYELNGKFKPEDIQGTPRVVSGLSPNTTYYYRVAAVVPAHTLTINLSIPNKSNKTVSAPNFLSVPDSYSEGTNGSFKTLAN